MTDNDLIRTEIRQLEAQRCKALIAGDIATLDAILAEPLIHIHGSGQIENKEAYLNGVANRLTFHRIERGELCIEFYDELVVATGPISQTVSLKGSDILNERTGIAIQTWIHNDTVWKQSICVNIFHK